MNVFVTTYSPLIKLSVGFDTLLTHFGLHAFMSLQLRPVFPELVDLNKVGAESIRHN